LRKDKRIAIKVCTCYQRKQSKAMHFETGSVENKKGSEDENKMDKAKDKEYKSEGSNDEMKKAVQI
jgi:hypothetical protein